MAFVGYLLTLVSYKTKMTITGYCWLCLDIRWLHDGDNHNWLLLAMLEQTMIITVEYMSMMTVVGYVATTIIVGYVTSTIIAYNA